MHGHDDDVVDRNTLHLGRNHLAVSLHERGLGRVAGEGLHGGSGATAGARFQIAAHADKAEDHRGGVYVHEGLIAGDERAVNTAERGDGEAHCDEQVHVRRTEEEGSKAADEDGRAGRAEGEHEQQDEFHEDGRGLAAGVVAPQDMAEVVDGENGQDEADRLDQRLAIATLPLAVGRFIGAGDGRVGAGHDLRVVADCAHGLHERVL